jgi:hypothetical protein
VLIQLALAARISADPCVWSARHTFTWQPFVGMGGKYTVALTPCLDTGHRVLTRCLMRIFSVFAVCYHEAVAKQNFVSENSEPFAPSHRRSATRWCSA